MLKNIALFFGVAFLALGILGFVPALTQDGTLLGLEVDGLHNIIHLATGLVAIMMAYASEHAARRYFQVFGIIYGIIAVLGFAYGESALLGIMAHNMADAIFHSAVALVSLYLGFATREFYVTSGRRALHT